jgi:hypothetical protein
MKSPIFWDVTYITHSLTELSPSREAAKCAAKTEEFPSILWNPKVHYRINKNPPLFPILNQIDLIHTIPSYLSKIHFNTVHPPTSWSSQWSLSFWISHQYPICIPLLRMWLIFSQKFIDVIFLLWIILPYPDIFLEGLKTKPWTSSLRIACTRSRFEPSTSGIRL